MEDLTKIILFYGRKYIPVSCNIEQNYKEKSYLLYFENYCVFIKYWPDLSILPSSKDNVFTDGDEAVDSGFLGGRKLVSMKTKLAPLVKHQCTAVGAHY